jgi:hypothetical protein
MMILRWILRQYYENERFMALVFIYQCLVSTARELTRSEYSSIDIATGQGLIPGKSKRFFCTLKC